MNKILETKTIARRPALSQSISLAAGEAIFLKDRHATAQANPELTQSLAMVSKILALPLIGTLVLYQRTLSPDHGFLKVLYPYGYCKFHPTCSEYAKLTLEKKGLLGLPLIVLRIIKCRPGTAGGLDPVK